MIPSLAAAMTLMMIFCVHLLVMNFMVTSRFPAINALGFTTMLLMVFYQRIFISIRKYFKKSDFSISKCKLMKLFSLIKNFFRKVNKDTCSDNDIMTLLDIEILDFYSDISKAIWDKHEQDVAMSRKLNTLCCSKPDQFLSKAISQFGNISHYKNTYPKHLFVPRDILIDFCMKNSLICIPIKLLDFTLPSHCGSDMEKFKAEDEDIWYSNFPDNIIEFGTDQAIKTNLGSLHLQEEGDISAFRTGMLSKLPYYVLLKTTTEVSTKDMTTKRLTGHGVILHPMPQGFIVVTFW